MRDAVVDVVGRPAEVGVLRSYLPAGWQVRNTAFVRPGRHRVDAIVLNRPSAALVRRTRSAHPVTPIVAIVDAADPVHVVVELIEAGADACVRSGRPDLLVAELREHLGPLRRRRLAA